MDYAIFRDYKNYIFFMNGKVYSLIQNRFLKPVLNNTTGYSQIGILNNKKTERKKFYLHRILGECFLKNPHNFKTIDHINRNPQNNKITNLRWASRRLQNINQKKRKDNKTGIKGVKFNKYNNSYIATWNLNKKKFTKTFSLKKYPDAKQLAIDYRAEMVEKHYKNII